MRNTRFRAWDNKNNCWYQPVHEAYKGVLFELMVSFSGDLSAHTLNGMMHESLWPNRFELMQFTGLHDKNNAPIYEGDVVRLLIGSEFFIGYVDYREYDCRFAIISDKNTQKNNYALTHRFEASRQYEVIGNIYENKELIL